MTVTAPAAVSVSVAVPQPAPPALRDPRDRYRACAFRHSGAPGLGPGRDGEPVTRCLAVAASLAGHA